MKNIIFILLFVFSLHSCSDFLETRAYDFASPEQFSKIKTTHRWHSPVFIYWAQKMYTVTDTPA